MSTVSTFKVVIFGDGGVGKTTLIEKFLTGYFFENMKFTIGSNYYRKNLTVMKKNIELEIWDYGGEIQFRKVFSSYVEGIAGAIFVFDLSRFVTITNIDEWMKLLKMGLGGKINIPLLIVGAKCDLETNRAVSKDFISKKIKEYGFTEYLECSAKTGLNIEEIFVKLTTAMLKTGKI